LQGAKEKDRDELENDRAQEPEVMGDGGEKGPTFND